MTQQPEFTPRRGSVSSHYEPPQEGSEPGAVPPLLRAMGGFVLGTLGYAALITAILLTLLFVLCSGLGG